MENEIHIYTSGCKRVAVVISADLYNPYTTPQQLYLKSLYPNLLNRFFKDNNKYDLFEIKKVSVADSRIYFLDLKKDVYCLINSFILWKQLSTKEKIEILKIK